MDREDWDELVTCAGCGAAIASASERSFAFGDENELCASCAMERGGRYDAERDAWDPPPSIEGLSDEAYGGSPREVRRGRGRD